MNRPRLMNARAAARYLGLSPRNFNRWRNDDNEPRIPQPVFRASKPFFVVDELDQFVVDLISRRGQPAK